MDASRIEYFLRLLGCRDITQGGRVVRADCPRAKWNHDKGTDRSRSFAVIIQPVSYWSCFACRMRKYGWLDGLLWEVAARNPGRDLSEALAMLQHHNSPTAEHLQAIEERERQRRERGEETPDNFKPMERVSVAGVVVPVRSAEEIPKLPVLDEKELDGLRNVPPEVMEHLLTKRRMTRESVAEWELGWHVAGQRIAIPIRDCENNLVGISGRAYRETQKPKYLHSSGFRRDFYLYGEHKIRKGEKGFLCEGFFDAIYLHQHGYNAVAMLGSYLSRFQVEKIQRFFKSLIIVPDGDPPGYEAAERILAQLPRNMPTRMANVPEGKDPDELTEEEMIDILGHPDRTTD